MANHLEYVLSGVGFTRLVAKPLQESAEGVAWVNDMFTSMQSVGATHGFSLLYNAWIEHSFGEIFKLFRPGLENVYADSGGLQIVTQGKAITEDMKEKVYFNQANGSTKAMCFDEIPVTILGDKSTRLDLGSRFFDETKFMDCAILTGKNIARQIEIFLDEKTKSQPILITQGNCLETYMQWTDLVLQQIPTSHHKYIGGIAMGAAALGHGQLEDIKRAFYFTQLPFEAAHNHVHILALGSVTRILPYLIFMQNGVFQDLHLSYDSTTHSSGIHMGRYYSRKGANLEFGRKMGPEWAEIYEDVCALADVGLDFEEFVRVINMPATAYEKETGDRVPAVKALAAMCCASVKNFIQHVERCVQSRKDVLKLADSRKSYLAFKHLHEVKTLQDFVHWETQLGRFLHSVPVQSSRPATLENFFE